MLPKIIVEKMDMDLNVNLMCRFVDPVFCNKNKTRPFAERSYLLYPELRGKIADGMSKEEINQLVRPSVEKVYINQKNEMEAKIELLQSEFDKIQEQLMSAMLELFQLDWPKEQENIICYVGCISSFPRNVMTKEFFVSYEKDIPMLMMASIHEINHFVVFEKWKSMHGYDKQQEPLYPDTLWFLEEMLVDPTLNIDHIQRVAPYPQKAYDQFYERIIGTMSAEEHLIQMFTNRNFIEEFMDDAYAFIEMNKSVLL